MKHLENTDFFLSEDEIARLTGLKQKKKQVEQLAKMRIRFELDAFGGAIVLRRAVEVQLGGESTWQSDDGKTNLKQSELNLG